MWFSCSRDQEGPLCEKSYDGVGLHFITEVSVLHHGEDSVRTHPRQVMASRVRDVLFKDKVVVCKSMY